MKNAEAWFGDDSLSREVIKHMFFPILKYSKNKDTKKIDYSRPPTIRAKVPNYDGKWGVEIYDTQSNLIFPCENSNMSPIDFVPKLSNVACVLNFSQVWIGGKGFGVMMKLVQCVVKPKLIESVFGKCHIQLSAEDAKTLDAQPTAISEAQYKEEKVSAAPADVAAVAAVAAAAAVVALTQVEDSDGEEEEVVEEEEQETVVVTPVAVAAVEPVKKKIIRKKV